MIGQETDNTLIVANGIAALMSLNREFHAISTKKRFHQYCLEDQVDYLEMENRPEENLEWNGQQFEFYAERKQTGYSARHISSILHHIRNNGRKALVIDLPRNRRLVFQSKTG